MDDEVIWRSPPRPWSADVRDALRNWLRAHDVAINSPSYEPSMAITAGDPPMLHVATLPTAGPDGRWVTDYTTEPPRYVVTPRTVPLLFAPPFTDTPPSTPKVLVGGTRSATRHQLTGYDAAQINANHREAAAVRPGWALERAVCAGEVFPAQIVRRGEGTYLYVDLTDLWVGPADETGDASHIGYLRRYPGDGHGRLVVRR